MQFVLACGPGNFKTELAELMSSSNQEQSAEATDVITSFSAPQEVLSLTVPISDFNIQKKNEKSYFYLITENSSTPNVDDANWSQTVPTAYTFTNEGTKTLYAWVKDSEGHIYNRKSVTLKISLPDMTPPTVSSFSIPGETNSAEILINSFLANDNIRVESYLITELPSKPLPNDPRWLNVIPNRYRIENYTINQQQGGQESSRGEASVGTPKTIYSWAKDSSGNVSASQSAVIILMPLVVPKTDTMPPNLYSFKTPISNGGLTIPITSVAGWDDFGITGYLITESNAAPLPSDVRWISTTPTNYVATSGGSKTLYLWAKDATGKVSTAISSNTYIYLDTANDPLVLILVRDYLYNDSAINLAINQLVGSLSLRGFANPEVQSVSKMNSNTLRQLLITKRSTTQRKFAGIFLIGDINQPTYVHPNDFNGATAVFPSDVALTSLDSTIIFSTIDGRFSNISGDQRPKIWLGRIDFSRNSLYGNELDTTKSYITKLSNDATVKMLSPLVGKSLLFVEKDWVSSSVVPSMPGFTLTAKNYPSLSQSSYLESIKQPYEMMHVMVHSNSNRHFFSQFSLSAGPGFLVETRLVNLFACSAVLPSSLSLLEPYMLSGTRGGIAVIGSTKTGSMANGQSQFYSRLYTNSKSIGDSFIEWQGDNLYGDYSKSWHMGMSINGDPTVKPSF
ncbi:MAG: hypothetical protein B7Y39_18105 [Bdellovibrio sp. 28-41-41]|nr:MAG: hypothetical protein B7Y39_18105 [Bdellovibrio sp. 28-41-41]